jgi:hypothetical protein
MTITAMAITLSLQADEQCRAEDERKAEERRAAEVQAPVHCVVLKSHHHLRLRKQSAKLTWRARLLQQPPKAAIIIHVIIVTS